jgi:hypothetical protein
VTGGERDFAIESANAAVLWRTVKFFADNDLMGQSATTPRATGTWKKNPT